MASTIASKVPWVENQTDLCFKKLRALVIISATTRALVSPRVLHQRLIAAGRRSYARHRLNGMAWPKW